MATETTVLLIDDLDGSRAHETVLFAIDGSQYVIDLSRDNADGLRDAMAPYVSAARKVPKHATLHPVRVTAVHKHTQLPAGAPAGTIRDWGRANGFKVSHRGRISMELEKAWQDAHP